MEILEKELESLVLKLKHLDEDVNLRQNVARRYIERIKNKA